MTLADQRSAPAHPGRIMESAQPIGPTSWFPPLPDARPPLSPRALTWFGVAALILLISAAATTVVMIDSAVPRQLPSLDDRYLGSVRANSTLTGGVVDDDTLIRTGHDVCAAVDRRPTLSTVLGAMTELSRTQRWREDDVAAVVGSAIGAYCPRHVPLLRD